MIPFPASECWLIGDDLRSVTTGNSIRLKITKDANERSLDRINCGPSDLYVLHLKFSGDPRILEFVNRCVAERFDFGTRGLRIEYGELLAGVAQGNFEPAYPAHQILNSRSIHSVIPINLWRRYKADHAANKARLEAEPTPSEVAG